MRTTSSCDERFSRDVRYCGINTGNIFRIGHSGSVSFDCRSATVSLRMFSVKVSVVLAVVVGVFAVSCTAYVESDITAYHFHTYFFEGNERHETEAMDFRKATRARIQDGFLSACSLNFVKPGIDGPHPFGQWELCCNASSVPQAVAWHMQNRGNLSILIHPLTREQLEDHTGRTTWIGASVPLDYEFFVPYPILPQQPRCPVYPEYPDEIPRSGGYMFEPLPGTEDYRNMSRLY